MPVGEPVDDFLARKAKEDTQRAVMTKFEEFIALLNEAEKRGLKPQLTQDASGNPTIQWGE